MRWLLLVLAALPVQGADRVALARARRLGELTALVAGRGLRWPLDEVSIRVFKEERVVEVWGGRAGQPQVLVLATPICAASGTLGPKRREGDLQVPEGLYEVSEFNPTSSYHLALKVSYPNASDRLRGDARRPGGLIYLHGSCVSIGCIAIEDGPVELVYLLALEARRQPVPLDIFPFRMTAERVAGAPPSYRALWAELLRASQGFEARHRRPSFSIDRRTGAYRIGVAPGP
jgi:murein L,D-transpeptidase YafK